MSMTPAEARQRLADVEVQLLLPKVMWHNQPGPQGDLTRAVVLLTKFLEDALA